MKQIFYVKGFNTIFILKLISFLDEQEQICHCKIIGQQYSHNNFSQIIDNEYITRIHKNLKIC